jgi:flagellar biosynthesis/type III secretory pathway chaperone
MTNLNVVVDQAFAGIDNANANAHALADLVTKKQTIAGALEKRRQQRDEREHSQSGFA